MRFLSGWRCGGPESRPGTRHYGPVACRRVQGGRCLSTEAVEKCVDEARVSRGVSCCRRHLRQFDELFTVFEKHLLIRGLCLFDQSARSALADSRVNGLIVAEVGPGNAACFLVSDPDCPRMPCCAALPQNDGWLGCATRLAPRKMWTPTQACECVSVSLTICVRLPRRALCACLSCTTSKAMITR